MTPAPASHAELRSLAGGIAALLPARELVIFGGAAYAMLTPGSPASGDIDVAVRGTPQDARACRERLAASTSCDRPTPVRPYWVHLTRPLVTFDVPWSGTVLDISFMDHWPQAHFDIETVTIHWPSMEVSDPWRVLRRPVTTIRLVTSLSDENPVLLLSRLLKLSAKYGLDLAADTYLADLAGKAAALASAWAPDDDFHAAVRRAADPEAFIGSCLAPGILDARLRPLADALRGGHALIGEVAAAAQALNRDEFWAHVDTLVPATPGWRGYRPAQGTAAASHRGVRPHSLTPIEGTSVPEGQPVSGSLAFWGEWEPQSRVVEEYPQATAGKPRWLQEPDWRRPVVSFPRHNTDPLVFGERFTYSNCRQEYNAKLRHLAGGSVILFGSGSKTKSWLAPASLEATRSANLHSPRIRASEAPRTIRFFCAL